MKVFEFHFNPKKKEDLLFDSFCYDPTTFDERKMGNLYAVGELKNALPQNYKLIDTLSAQIKKEYYISSLRTPEKSLTEALKRGNEYLEGLTKKGDVSWLGNLNFAVLSIKDSIFHFTKAEKMFAFLLRGGKIVNIAQKLVQEEINPYPLKFFGNFISGKLMNEDVVVIMTKEVANFFITENILNEVASLSVFTDKKLKEILSLKEKELKEISGVAVLVSFTEEKEKLTKNETPQVLNFDKAKDKFSLADALSPITKIFMGLWKLIRNGLKKLVFKIPLPNIKINIPFLNLSRSKVNKFRPPVKIKKNVFVIGAFIIILLIGFYAFQIQGQKQLAGANKILESVQTKKSEAQQLFDSGNKKESNPIFLSALEDLNSLAKSLPETKQSSAFKRGFENLRQEIDGYLLQLNNFTVIDNPEIVFDFSGIKSSEGDAFAPQKMIAMGKSIYFFNPAIKNIFGLNLNTKTGEIINKDQKFNFGFPLDSETIMFYGKPDNITYFKAPNEFIDSKIQFPINDFNVIAFKINFSNLYFLDQDKKLILKCPYDKNAEKQNCQYWFSKNNTKLPDNPVSFAADGNIWILNKNGSIDRYWAGAYQETLKADYYPLLENPDKIYTLPGIPYLYILEPVNNKVLVFKKTGEIVAQFQSEKFDNIKDITVSSDGKTIYLLNGLSLFKITF